MGAGEAARELQVPFCDLGAGFARRAEALEAALLRVARSGTYVLGEEVAAFEHELAASCGADLHAVGVGSGTDALTLILRAAGIGDGDEVLVPAYTAAATWMAVAWAGARPVAVDVDEHSGLIDADAAAERVTRRTRAVIAVHLFGRLAPVASLRTLATTNGLMLIEDAAQAHGADEGDGIAGSLADAAAFSFYPTKLVGGLGDGGAVVTCDAALAERVRRLRSYGWETWQGDARVAGTNSRLDELQAAVLRAGLDGLGEARARLVSLAGLYRRQLAGLGEDRLGLPVAPDGIEPAWHQFVVRCERRASVREALREGGIGTALHYDPIPTQLSVFASSAAAVHAPRAEALAARALSLPLDPWLGESDVRRVCDVLTGALIG